MHDTEEIIEHPLVKPTTGDITLADRWVHLLARIGINRNGHHVEPGLYCMGNATAGSPVFVSANYKLSFDALRSALKGIDCFILVLDTKGINVWCAAGKGTFGTEEILHRLKATGLCDVVDHRVLLVPQLGAPGVAAHEVKKRSGFKVEYGPVRSADLPEYLETCEATPEMRRVKFNLLDRMMLIPVELSSLLLPLLVLAVLSYIRVGLSANILTDIGIIVSGVILFPILLPWLPTHNFSTKGFFLGALLALPFTMSGFLGSPDVALWQRAGEASAQILLLSSIVAFLSLNFTGATTYTSRSGVRREMFAYIPVMAVTFGGAVVISVLLKIFGA